MPICILMSKIIFTKHLPLLGPNRSQNQKSLEFIEIWSVKYLKYADLNFDV